jgi:hypothetical protein
MRRQAGLTKRLANQVGTTTSVICRIEDADYEGHSLAMLRLMVASTCGAGIDRRSQICEQ